jgi:hypothetical protein
LRSAGRVCSGAGGHRLTAVIDFDDDQVFTRRVGT